ncbi:MAG: phospholipase D-like domain-containing protein [Candidatus Thorarchaeota archaeon]
MGDNFLHASKASSVITAAVSALLLAVFLTFPHPAYSWGRDVVDIIDLHHNDSDGVPAPPYTIGTPVTITGVVTVGVGTFTYSYTEIFVQDATGGIMVYNPSVLYEFAIGDTVTIDGEIAQYRGMTEVYLDTYTVHGSGAPLPDPLVVTCDDVEHAFLPDYSEPNEGRLVRINNVTWSGTWPTFSGPITLHDETGTCTLYIDGTTGIQDMTPPTGPFDVMGVIKQYAGYDPPYTSDYEIMPRSPDDFILLPGPQIIDGPRETNIQYDNVTIHLETDTPTTAIVQYGETESYELGTATDGIEDTVHDIVLTGLEAATIHHYRVTVEDEEGQTTTPDLLFCSASEPGCTGQIIALFNKSVDHDLAVWSPAPGGRNLESWIIAQIDSAQYTIDVMLYSFDLPDVADALIAAKDRGVQIRFIYENRDTYQNEVQRLINHGIIVIDDSFGPNDGDELMHDKLWIFDVDSPDPTDPWVWTGSWNLTPTGTTTDAQNVVLIQDRALARVCTEEFNEMWGSSGLVPNPDHSRFGTNKTDNTPKRFNIGGRNVEMYFAPSDPWLGAVVEQVEHADNSIHFCVLSYTRWDLCNEMEDRWMNVPGMEIRGVFDSSESGNEYSQYWPMHGEGEYAWDPPADVLFDGENGTLHHKYMIIDTNRDFSDPVLITGSANWSNAAVNENDENLIIIHDPEVANWYFQEFAERYHAAGGTAFLGQDAPEPKVATLPLRVQTPSSHPVASLRLEEPTRVLIEIFSIDGRSLASSRIDLQAGENSIGLDGFFPECLSSGTYYLRLSGPAGGTSVPFVIVR